jgi:hypothetical protein
VSRLPPARAVAAFDSASAMLRSTAAALQGRDFPHLGRGRPSAAAVRATALLPGPARRAAYSLAGGAGGVQDVLGPAHLLGVDERRFPSDFPAFARYGPALRGERPRWPLPGERLPLSVLDDVDAALSASRQQPQG